MCIIEYNLKVNRDILRNELVVEKKIDYLHFGNVMTPDVIVDILNSIFDVEHLADEHVYLFTLNGGNRITGVFEIAHGGATMCLFPVREIFHRALLVGAVQIIIVHNHPSGICKPSKEDIMVTEKLKKASDIIGVGLLDHIIIGYGEFYSMKQKQDI